MLKELAVEIPGVKATKKGLKFLCPYRGCLAGEMYFEYLRKAEGFYVGCEVDAGLIHEICTTVGGEWGSSLLNNSTLSFTSLAEENREFSDEVGGVIRLFGRMNIDEAVADIKKRVYGFHVMKIRNLIDCSIGLLEDVKTYPAYYSRPLVICALCMKLNGVDDGELLTQIMAKNKRVGRIDIDTLEKKISSLDFSIFRKISVI